MQRKIIYLPNVPLGGRNEALSPPSATTASQLAAIDWELVVLPNSQKPSIHIHTLQLRSLSPLPAANANPPPVVLIYLQGNAGTPLHRLPVFRSLLVPPPRNLNFTILAPAPRSFWNSTRAKPSQSGFLSDYSTAIAYARKSFGPQARIVLYGHSIGGAATIFLSRHRDVDGIIVDNPLPSIPYMLRTLYAHPLLPYRYLGPFAFDKWDALAASCEGTKPSLWIRSGRDELVGGDGVKTMFENWKGDKQWVEMKDGLHDTAWRGRRWRKEVEEFCEAIAKDQRAEARNS